MKSYYPELYKYFKGKASKYKSYKTTADRFESDDFNVIGCDNRWWIERQTYCRRISEKTFNHIKGAMKKLYGLKYLYE